MGSKPFLIVFGVIVLTLVVPKLSSAQGLACKDIFKPSIAETVLKNQIFFDRKANDIVDWNNDLSYKKARRVSEDDGVVRSFFSERWDTQVYFSAPGTFQGSRLRESSLVSAHSSAAFIFIHGSGTVKSGGRNFIGIMNTLNKIGISSMSFDLPFHAQGPTRDQQWNYNYSMEWLKRIVEDVKAQGKPVYLVGHSFGPDVIFELVSKYKNLVSGALAISPAGFNKVLDKWYLEHTSKMKFGGDVLSSELGGQWAGKITEQMGWSRGKYQDPTEDISRFHLRILSGDREEYVPAPVGGSGGTPIGKNTYDISRPLQRIFKNAKIVIEPGVGHYIFEHKDANGNGVVNRELLALVGLLPSDVAKVANIVSKINSQKSDIERLADLYAVDPLFPAWLQTEYGGRNRNLINKIVQQYDIRLAKKIIDQYSQAKKQRDEQLLEQLIPDQQNH